jgi:hypothetical protein
MKSSSTFNNKQMNFQHWHDKISPHWKRFVLSPYEHLFWSLIILFFSFAFVNENNIFGRISLTFFFLMTVLCVIETFKLRQKFLNIFRAIAVLSFIFSLLAIIFDYQDNKTLYLLGQVIDLIFISIAVLVIIKKIFSDTKVTGDTLRGGISVYLMLGIVWFQIYQIILTIIPKAFEGDLSGYQVFYVSFVTLTTVGYGDILPVHRATMIMANLEAIAGQLYPAVIIARLVSLYTVENSSKD